MSAKLTKMEVRSEVGRIVWAMAHSTPDREYVIAYAEEVVALRAVRDGLRDLDDALALSRRHRGLGDYSEAAMCLERDVERFLHEFRAALTPAEDDKAQSGMGG